MQSVQTLVISISISLCTTIGFSQQLTGFVKSKSSQESIPFASVQIGENYGVITNTEGLFQIQTEKFLPTDSLLFSSMGFESKKIALKDFQQNSTIYLADNINELAEVYLVNKNLTPDEILEKVTKKASENYSKPLAKYTIFARKSGKSSLKDFNFEINKATFLPKKTQEKFNKEIKQAFKNDKHKNIEHRSYSEDYFSIYKNNDSIKIDLIKLTALENPETSLDGEKIAGKIFKLIAKNLDSKNTFKVKSGIIPVDDSLKVGESFKIKEENEADTVKTAHWRESNLLGINHEKNILEAQKLDFLTNYPNYKFQLDEITGFNNEMVYILSFTPNKRKAKYTGKLYISADTFAVLKAEYQLAPGKRTNSFNMKFLLGVKIIQDKDAGTLVFRKNKNNSYDPVFFRREMHQYIYLNRSVSFKENTQDKKNRIKFKFDFKIETNNHLVSESLFVDNSQITEKQFDNFTEKTSTTVEEIRKYDASIWENYNIIAPDEAIKAFEY